AALDAVVALDTDAPLSSAEAALRSGHEDVRVRGLDRLVKLGTATQGAEPLLGDALEDESAKVRGEAFRTLWAWNEKEPEKALDRALSGRFPDLRGRAVEVFSQRGTEGWALERLRKTVEDRDAGVATAAYDAWVKLAGKEKPEPHLAALASTHAALRIAGAKGSVHAPVETLRSPLLKLVQDENVEVAVAALEALDKLVPKENGPLLAGSASASLYVRVRAAELLAPRGAEDIIEPMRVLMTDKDLERLYPPAFLNPLRIRAAQALATLGSRRLLNFFATVLVPHTLGELQEQGARGLATASRRGDEGYLLDALGHRQRGGAPRGPRTACPAWVTRARCRCSPATCAMTTCPSASAPSSPSRPWARRGTEGSCTAWRTAPPRCRRWCSPSSSPGTCAPTAGASRPTC
ncbi:HEAT repeat domain-containing protein, partial [Pyxidicoccus sp. 3LFB2]